MYKYEIDKNNKYPKKCSKCGITHTAYKAVYTDKKGAVKQVEVDDQERRWNHKVCPICHSKAVNERHAMLRHDSQDPHALIVSKINEKVRELGMGPDVKELFDEKEE